MATKAAHHLNNPIHAIVRLLESRTMELNAIRQKLEGMFPSAEQRSIAIKKVIESFRQNFQSIEENASLMKRSLKRATGISNELRIVSRVHGSQV